jgi:hypothetical protein
MIALPRNEIGLTPRFKFTLITVTVLTLFFFVANVSLVALFPTQTPAGIALVDNTARAWQSLLTLLAGLLGGKAL